MIMDHASAHARYFPPFISRRRELQAGALGWLGFDLAGVVRAAEQRASQASGRKGHIRSCILLYYYGGPRHLDTWDMKLQAPREVRGEFGSIPTLSPGLRV